MTGIKENGSGINNAQGKAPGDQAEQYKNKTAVNSAIENKGIQDIGTSLLRPQLTDLEGKKIPHDKIIAGVINGLVARTPWKSTCLVKALAAHKMLKRRNISSRIHFGVKKSSDNDFEAHAWLSVGDKVIIGGENLEDFVELGSY